MKILTGKEILQNILNILHEEKDITKSSSYSVGLSLKDYYFKIFSDFILDDKVNKNYDAKLIISKIGNEIFIKYTLENKVYYLRVYVLESDGILSTSGKYYDLLSDDELIIKGIIE